MTIYNYSVIYLSVLDHEFVETPVDQTVLAGNSVTIHCEPPASDPPASIHWFYNDTPITERTGRYAMSVLENGGLYFANVQLLDIGLYVCSAVNHHAIPASVSATPLTLTVHGKLICFVLF